MNVPSIADIRGDDLKLFSYRILAIEPTTDPWVDDHIPCIQVKVKTEAGEIEVGLWWCGDVAYLVRVAHESPTAMAAVLHFIYGQIEEARADENAESE